MNNMSRLLLALRSLVIAALLTLGVVLAGGQVAAQDAATEVATEAAETVDEATDTAEDADDGFDDWGLLGLLGLLGLGGLFRRPQPVVHDTDRTGFTSASDRIDNTGL
jgi:MYXO-CTERM domain-containing protein